MSNSKNIGQVVGLFIGTVPPTNTALIWYDETPNQRCHKVYNPMTNLWQVLNPDIISITTYSELINNAKKNGLGIGKQYLIRDKGNALATAITPNKIQYVDTLGNIVSIIVDDLGTNTQYHVSSDNILIDDIHGNINPSNQLKFTFDEKTFHFETDYLLGKVRSETQWLLAKVGLKKLLSANMRNSISWNNGFFFSFADAIKAILDKSGGIVSKNAYDKKIREIDVAIGNVSKENQNIINLASQTIKKATTDEAIYNKKFPIHIDTTIAPGDIKQGDALSTIISKIQRWINKFQYATGIRLSSQFVDAQTSEFINSNDTVESAFGKIQYYLKNPTLGVLPEDFDTSLSVDGSVPQSGDTIAKAFGRMKLYLQNLHIFLKLSTDWGPKDYNSNVELPTAGDTLEEAFAKAVAKFNQIGFIYNGVIESRQRNPSDNSAIDGTPKMHLDLKQGVMTLRGNGSSDATSSNTKDFMVISPSEIQMGNDEAVKDSLNINHKTFEYRGQSSRYYGNESGSIRYITNTTPSVMAAFISSNANVALAAKNSMSHETNYFDAFFGKIKMGAITLDYKFLDSRDTTYYNIGHVSMIVCDVVSTKTMTVALPSSPESGRTIFIYSVGAGTLTVQAVGEDYIVSSASSAVSALTLSSSQWKMYMFVYHSNAAIWSPNEKSGMWTYVTLSK